VRAPLGAGLSLAAALLAAGAAWGEGAEGIRDGGLEIRTDAGVCKVHASAMPSVGYGCHVHWEEPGPDGIPVDAMAPLRCGQSIRVCGEELSCTCPRR